MRIRTIGFSRRLHIIIICIVLILAQEQMLVVSTDSSSFSSPSAGAAEDEKPAIRIRIKTKDFLSKEEREGHFLCIIFVSIFGLFPVVVSTFYVHILYDRLRLSSDLALS